MVSVESMHGVLREAAFEQHARGRRRSARQWLRATGTRPSAATSQVMTARCAPGPAGARSPSSGGIGSSLSAVNRSSNGTTPSGGVAAEAADIADRKDLGGDLHGEVEMIDRADPPAHDQRIGADAARARPPHSARRHNSGSGIAISPARSTPSSVSTLSTVLAICMPTIASRVQPHAAQPPGDGRDHAIGLRIGEAARLAVGEAVAVGRIEQRNVVGPPLRRPAEQLVERGASADARSRPVGRVDR